MEFNDHRKQFNGSKKDGALLGIPGSAPFIFITCPHFDRWRDHYGTNGRGKCDATGGLCQPADWNRSDDGERYHVRGSGYRYTDSTLMGFTILNGEYHDDNGVITPISRS